MQRAQLSGMPVYAAVYDLSLPWFPDTYFDVILNFRFLERATFPVYRRALKAGGLIFFETFVKADQNISNPHYYLEPGELLKAFHDFKILHWQEDVRQDTTRAVAQLIAQKPSHFVQ